MPHPNKTKGDRAERDVLKIISKYDPAARRTRPGRREDEGDIHALGLTWQVKDVAQPRWRDWLAQLHQQIAVSPYQYGVLVWKLRGFSGKPAKWLAVMELDHLCGVQGGALARWGGEVEVVLSR